MKRLVSVLAMGMLLLNASTVLAETDAQMQAQIAALQERVAELEAAQSDQAIQQRTTELVEQMLSDMDYGKYGYAADTGVVAGHDKRFFIKTTDDQFRLEFDTRFQVRYTYALTDDNDRKLLGDGTRASLIGADGLDSSYAGFDIERARLYLRGHVFKDLKYNISIEQDDDVGGDAYLYGYELSYAFMPELGVRVGRYKGAFGKQENTSSGALMLIDRSLANEVFNIDRTTGAELFGSVDLGEVQPHYRMGVYNGLQNNNSAMYYSTDNSMAVAARVAVPLMGASPKDFVNESDLIFHESPVAQVGLSLAYGNDRDEDHALGGESDDYEFLARGMDGRADIYELGGEVSLVGADLAVKCHGFSAILEGFYQHVDGDSAEVSNEGDFGSRSDIDGLELDNWGWHAQAGYFLIPETFELVSRMSGVCVDSTNDSYEYAAGWNWYLYGQDLKLSMDVTYIDDLPLVSTSPNFDGIQNNALFLIRTQLQFQF